MTREEIKNIPELVDLMLDECVFASSREKLRKRLDEICNLAIGALEQEPCSDAISRQAVIDVVNNPLNIRLDEIIKKLPSVNPQPKTGHWINGDDKCPCCGKSKYEGLDADIWADWQPKFCPNCGVRMESEV